VSAVIDHAKSHEKKEVFESLQPSFQWFLQDRHDVIHLANDVFNSLTHKTSLERDIKPNHGLIFRIMSGDIGSIVFKMLSVQDVITYAISTTETYRSLPIWNNIRQACFPKLNTAYIRGYREGNPEGLRMAMRLSHYAHHHFHNLFENRKKIIDNTIFMESIHVIYTPIFVKALRGYLLMSAEFYTEALQLLTQAGEATIPLAQQLINKAAAHNEFETSSEDSRAIRAQSIRYGDTLGFNDVLGRSYLEDRIRQGDQHAQECLNWAAVCRSLGFDAVTGRAYLEDRIRQGDQGAQRCLNQAAQLPKGFGFDDVGRAYLEERIRQGDQHAQECLNWAARRCWKFLGFNQEAGRIYLEEHRAAATKAHKDISMRRLGRCSALEESLGLMMSQDLHTLKGVYVKEIKMHKRT
jgi:hypothetical protein